MTMSMSVQDQVLTVTGDLDRFVLGNTKHYQFPAVSGDVTVDLAKVTSVDTAGLAWVLKLVCFYKSRQQAVLISNEPQQLIALASISNALNLLPLKNS